MKANQKGFSVVEILIVIVVVGLLGAVGWLVYDRQNNKRESVSTSSQTDTKETENGESKQELVVDQTSDWKEIKNAEYGFSYKYPSDSKWQADIVKEEIGSELYSRGQRINVADASYVACGKNCGLAFYLQVFEKGSIADVGVDYVENTQMKDNNVYKLSTKTTVTQDNVKGTRWEYLPSNDNAAKIVFYYFTRDNYAYFFQINLNGAKTDKVDITERGEKIMGTFRFTN
jgi:prepilin-type N-terminal cleavage/methylation domain-containing protein